VTPPALMAALEAKITALGSARNAATYFNISEPYLSQIRHSHKDMPEWIGIALGWRRVWVKMEADNGEV